MAGKHIEARVSCLACHKELYVQGLPSHWHKRGHDQRQRPPVKLLRPARQLHASVPLDPVAAGQWFLAELERRPDWTATQLAHSLQLSHSVVATRIALAKAVPELHQALWDGQIDVMHALAVASGARGNPELQRAALAELISQRQAWEKLTYAQAMDVVRRLRPSYPAVEAPTFGRAPKPKAPKAPKPARQSKPRRQAQPKPRKPDNWEEPLEPIHPQGISNLLAALRDLPDEEPAAPPPPPAAPTPLQLAEREAVALDRNVGQRFQPKLAACPICGAQVREADLIDHQVKVHPDAMLPCPHCGRTYLPSAAKRHQEHVEACAKLASETGRIAA